MIPSLGSHALKALTPQAAVKVDHSRCVRHRCKRNACSRCLDICPAEAITWGEQGLHVSPNRCKQCLRCLSVCPTAALQPPELSLLQVLTDLAAHAEPVLGCHRHPEAKNHARFSCLGYLAHSELMLLLALVFPGGLQVDLTRCQNCSNRDVLDGIHAVHSRLVTVLPEHKVALVNDQGVLGYKPNSLSRRELFGFFRERSSRSAVLMVERLQDSSRAQSYGSKQVPLVRSMLLKAMKSLSELQQKHVVERFFGQISFTETCTACGGCVGVCPTGAIEPAEQDGASPIFDRRLCVSCRSCQAFCRKQGVELTNWMQNQSAASLTSA